MSESPEERILRTRLTLEAWCQREGVPVDNGRVPEIILPNLLGLTLATIHRWRRRVPPRIPWTECKREGVVYSLQDISTYLESCRDAPAPVINGAHRG